jgi:hypothetical protein
MQEGLSSLEVIQKVSKICDANKKENEITIKVFFIYITRHLIIYCKITLIFSNMKSKIN